MSLLLSLQVASTSATVRGGLCKCESAFNNVSAAAFVSKAKKKK